MLSKFSHFYSIGRESSAPPSAEELNSVASSLGETVKSVKKVRSSAACACFIMNEKWFLKCRLDNNEESLAREALIGNFVSDDKDSAIILHQGKRPWLINSIYQACGYLDPEKAIALVRKNAVRLQCFPEEQTSKFESLEAILDLAKQSHEQLYRASMINSASSKLILQAVGTLQRRKLQRCLSHGDFGPANIMVRKSEPVAIDWEDAFIGVEDYDFYYWLTFFENRKFYNRPVLRLGRQDADVARSLMIIVVSLKCQLSFLMKTYLADSLSFDQRLLEVSNLD